MVVPKRLQRNFKLLKLLQKSKKTQRHKLLKTADNDLIVCLCDCANNILKGNVKLKPKEKRQLSRHKKILRTLASGNSLQSVKKKRNLLIQKGGFLPLLLTPILSAAGGLLSSLISGRGE